MLSPGPFCPPCRLRERLQLNIIDADFVVMSALGG